MPRELETYLATLPAEDQGRIAARGAAFAEELDGLRALRATLAAAHGTLGAHLHAGPQALQRMERRVDLYVAALREALHALGGELEIVVRLPGRAPVALTGFEGLLGSEPKEET